MLLCKVENSIVKTLLNFDRTTSAYSQCTCRMVEWTLENGQLAHIHGGPVRALFRFPCAARVLPRTRKRSNLLKHCKHVLFDHSPVCIEPPIKLILKNIVHVLKWSGHN